MQCYFVQLKIVIVIDSVWFSFRFKVTIHQFLLARTLPCFLQKQYETVRLVYITGDQISGAEADAVATF